MRGILRFTATAALGGLLLLGCGRGSSDGGGGGDVSIGRCTAGPGGEKPVAEGTVKNSTGKPSTYIFRITFLDPQGNQVSQANNGVGRVEPGETATWDVQGITAANGPLTCKVQDVTRTALA